MKIFDELWVSSSYNSETISLAGTKAVINEMIEKDTISHCWDIGTKLFDGWNKTVESNNIDAKMYGYPIRMDLRCYDSQKNQSLAMRSLLVQEMMKEGIFISPLLAVYLSYSHSESDIEKTLSVLDNACKKINEKVSNDDYEKFLEGKMPKIIWNMSIAPTKKKIKQTT